MIAFICNGVRIQYPAIESLHMREIATAVRKDGDGNIILQQEDRAICIEPDSVAEIIKAIREVEKEKV